MNREGELKSLCLLLEKTKAGTGRLVFLCGEAGIGKTRLASRVFEVAKQMGFRILYAKCMRGRELPSYTPWIELMRQFMQEASAQSFFDVCGQDLGEILRLVPELSQGMRETGLSLTSSPDTQRKKKESKNPDDIQKEMTRFLLAQIHFFLRLAEKSPLLICIDDLQWCDDASLRLLQSFQVNNFTKLPIFLLCLYRDVEVKEGDNPSLSAFINDLQASRQYDSIQLQRLGRENVDQLVNNALPGFGSKLGDLVYSKTRGNPLFVKELLKALIERGLISSGKGAQTIKLVDQILVPKAIADVIRQRLDYLDDRTLTLLRVASVIGENFTHEILEAVTARLSENPDLLQYTEKAVKAGLVIEKELHTGKISYEFSDESVRDLLYDELNLRRRQEYHITCAKAIEAQYSALGGTGA